MIENILYLQHVYKVAQKTSVNRNDMNAVGVAYPNTSEIIFCGVQRKIADVKENWIKRCEYLTPEEDLVLGSVQRQIDLSGMNLYTPWGLSVIGFRYAILLGIRKVVTHKKAMELRRNTKFYRDINKYLPEYGVEYVEFDGDINCDFDFTVNGRTFIP